MYQESHAFVADLLALLDNFTKTHPGENVPYVTRVEVWYPGDDRPMGYCIDEIGGAFCFVEYKEDEGVTDGGGAGMR